MKELILLLHLIIYSITPELSYSGGEILAKLNGRFLKQDKITYNHGKIVKIYTIYEKKTNCNITSYSTMQNCCLELLH